MSEIRSTGNTKSIVALSASLNRALAGVRQHQVAAARQVQVRAAAHGSSEALHGRRVAHFDRVAARRRTNLLIGTLDRLRTSPATRVARSGPPSPARG
jgi:hypothetical protein